MFRDVQYHYFLRETTHRYMNTKINMQLLGDFKPHKHTYVMFECVYVCVCASIV